MTCGTTGVKMKWLQTVKYDWKYIVFQEAGENVVDSELPNYNTS
jgi:hypothetical protein